MKLALSCLLLALCASAFAQLKTTVYAHEVNHGGWGYRQAIGADGKIPGKYKGDRIAFDIRCDHDVKGECFDGPPTLVQASDFNNEVFKFSDDDAGLRIDHLLPQHPPADGSPFTLAADEFDHQLWTVRVPKTGLWVIKAEYFWVGWGVHYWITLTAKEKPAL